MVNLPNTEFYLSSIVVQTDMDIPEEEVTEHHATVTTRENVEGTNHPVIPTEPQDDDVLLGRGRSHAKRPANIRFQRIISNNRQLYFGDESKMHKKTITEDIMNEIGGRFLRPSSTQRGWVELPREVARVKVAQALQYRQRVEENSFCTSGAKFRRVKEKNANTKNRTRPSTGSDKSFGQDVAPTVIPNNDDDVWQPLPLEPHEQEQAVELISDAEIYWALNVDLVQLRHHNEALERGCCASRIESTKNTPAIGTTLYNEQQQQRPVSNHFYNGAKSSAIVSKGSLVTPTTSMEFQRAGHFIACDGVGTMNSSFVPNPNHIVIPI